MGMLLELSLGQLFQRGDIGVFRGIHPRLYGVGLASVFSAFAINIFYTYLIAIACCYMFAGFVSPLPWSIQRTAKYQEAMCDENNFDASMGRDCLPAAECASSGMYITEEWFRKDLLRSMVMTKYQPAKVMVSVPTLDSDCEPVLDSDGNPTSTEVETDFALPLFDVHGSPVMVAVTDCNGNAVVDDDGEAVMQQA